MQRELDGTRLPQSLFEAAAWHYNVIVRCRCGRETVFHAAALWWRFERKNWNNHELSVCQKMRCDRCGEKQATIAWSRTREPTSDLPLPAGREWKRAVDRYRG